MSCYYTWIPAANSEEHTDGFGEQNAEENI
jgi:hypothetical protein